MQELQLETTGMETTGMGLPAFFLFGFCSLEGEEGGGGEGERENYNYVVDVT